MEKDSGARLNTFLDKKEEFNYLEFERLSLVGDLERLAARFEKFDSIKADNLRQCAASIRSLKT